MLECIKFATSKESPVLSSNVVIQPDTDTRRQIQTWVNVFRAHRNIPTPHSGGMTRVAARWAIALYERRAEGHFHPPSPPPPPPRLVIRTFFVFIALRPPHFLRRNRHHHRFRSRRFIPPPPPSIAPPPPHPPLLIVNHLFHITHTDIFLYHIFIILI